MRKRNLLLPILAFLVALGALLGWFLGHGDRVESWDADVRGGVVEHGETRRYVEDHAIEDGHRDPAPDHGSREPDAAGAEDTKSRVSTSPRLGGIVFDPDGRIVPNARIGLFAMTDDTIRSQALATTRTGRDGSFRISPPEAFRGDLVLTARGGAWRPATRRATWNGQTIDGVELRLETGFDIAGRVHEAGRPLAGVSVFVDIRWGTPGLFGAGTEAFWIDDRVEEKHRHAVTGADGMYRFRGLGPHVHDLHVGGPSGVETHPELAAMRRTEVHAPNVTADVDLAAAMLDIRVTSRGLPLADSRVDIDPIRTGASGWTRSPFPEGGLAVAVVPHKQYRVVVTHRGHARRELMVTSPGPGSRLEVHADLEAVMRPSLLIRLVGARTDEIRHLDVIFRNAERKNLERFAADRVDPGILRVRDIPLAAGSYRITVGPRSECPVGRYMLPVRTEVSLPALGEADVTIAPQLGGRFDVSFEADADSFGLEFDLVDAEGVVVLSRRYHTMHDGMVMFETGSSTGEERWDVHPPGEYTLRVDAGGFKRVRRPVEIEPAASTRVRVKLQRP